MKKIALGLATLVAFMLPLTAQSADAKTHDHKPVTSRAIDWD